MKHKEKRSWPTLMFYDRPASPVMVTIVLRPLMDTLNIRAVSFILWDHSNIRHTILSVGLWWRCPLCNILLTSYGQVYVLPLDLYWTSGFRSLLKWAAIFNFLFHSPNTCLLPAV